MYVCVYIYMYVCFIYIYINILKVTTAVIHTWAPLVAQLLKNLPAIQESWVRFLGQEDPLEKQMATHSSILVWKIPWTEEPGRLQSMRSQESDTI